MAADVLPQFGVIIDNEYALGMRDAAPAAYGVAIVRCCEVVAYYVAVVANACIACGLLFIVMLVLKFGWCIGRLADRYCDRKLAATDAVGAVAAGDGAMVQLGETSAQVESDAYSGGAGGVILAASVEACEYLVLIARIEPYASVGDTYLTTYPPPISVS